MSTDFPGAVDGSSTLPNPSATSPTNNPSLAAGQSNQNDAIKATETKLGTGSSTPASNTLLVGTGAGASTWQGLTSAQLAAILSDETGTGANVFANTPTLITPKVDTINESTPANGVTIDGLNIKDNALNTNNSVPTAAIQNAAVTSSKLSLDTVENVLASNFTSGSTSGTFSDTGVKVTLAAAGTWLIISTQRLTTAANTQYGWFRLFNQTTSVAVPNSVTLGHFSSTFGDSTTSICKFVTTSTTSNIIRLEVTPGGAYTVGVTTDVAGGTRLEAVRIG